MFTICHYDTLTVISLTLVNIECLLLFLCRRKELKHQRHTPNSMSAALILGEQQITGDRSRLLEARRVACAISLSLRSMVRL